MPDSPMECFSAITLVFLVFTMALAHKYTPENLRKRRDDDRSD
jgi:hypothetical protein